MRLDAVRYFIHSSVLPSNSTSQLLFARTPSGASLVRHALASVCLGICSGICFGICLLKHLLWHLPWHLLWHPFRHLLSHLIARHLLSHLIRHHSSRSRSPRQSRAPAHEFPKFPVTVVQDFSSSRPRFPIHSYQPPCFHPLSLNRFHCSFFTFVKRINHSVYIRGDFSAGWTAQPDTQTGARSAPPFNPNQICTRLFLARF